MLITNTHLPGTAILSFQSGAPIGVIQDPIIDPNSLKIIAFKLSGHFPGGTNILDTNSVREYSQLGLIIDNEDELVTANDVVKISQVLSLNFNLVGLKVETKKGSKLGHITGFTFTSEDFIIQQIIVKRPPLKAIIDPELVISRKEIVEITDYKVIVRDEEKVLKERAEKEDFIPNFVNPFRNNEFYPSPAHTETPADKDTE